MEPSVQFSSVQFSHSVVSDSLRLHESQHARPPCPSPTPRVQSNSCALSPWCHPAISSSVIPFSSCPNPSQHQGLFKWVNSLHEVAKVLEFQPQHQSFQWTPRTGPYFKNSEKELQISWASFIQQRIIEKVGHTGCKECIKLNKTLKGKTN